MTPFIDWIGLTPVLAEDDFREIHASAAPKRAGQRVRHSGIAEIEDVFAMPVVRIAQDVAAQLVVVNGRRH